MRNFGGSERMTRIMDRFGMEEGEAVENRLMNKVIEGAQKRVEQRNYMWRKHVLDYDDVMNQQRTIVYAMRNDALLCEEPRIMLYENMEEAVGYKCESYVNDEHDGSVHAESLNQWANSIFPIATASDSSWLEGKRWDDAKKLICERVKELYEKKVSGERPDYVDRMERSLMLQAIDKMWQRHINDMDALREGVRLRAQGQRDPLVEYKREAYGLFETLMQDIQLDMIARMFRSTTNLSAFEDFLASLPVDDGTAGASASGMEGDLLASLREQLQQLHEREQAALAGDEAASGALPGGVLTSKEKKVNLPNRKKRFVNIKPEKTAGPANGASPVYNPEDSNPTI